MLCSKRSQFFETGTVLPSDQLLNCSWEASTTRKKVDFIIKTVSIHRCPTRQKAAMTKKVMSKNQKIIIPTNYRWPAHHWCTGCGAIQTNGWDILNISVHFCCWITGVEDRFIFFCLSHRFPNYELTSNEKKKWLQSKKLFYPAQSRAGTVMYEV